MVESLKALFERDLRTLEREIELYPGDEGVWVNHPSATNSGGVLARHLCGNLQHFAGAVLGGSGYRRDRVAEFGAPPVTRQHLLMEIRQTRAAVAAALSRLSDDQLHAPYPEPVAGHRFRTGDFLCHLTTHLAYHLGQVDYHRRLTAGGGPAGAMALSELASAVPA